MNETTYSKTQLKKSTPVELDAILIERFSYKPEGVVGFSKSQKVQLILDLQTKPEENSDAKPDEKPPLFSEEQIADFAAHCAAIGESDLNDAVCQACKSGDGFPEGQFGFCQSLIVKKATTTAGKKAVKASGPTNKMRGKYTSLEELVNALKNLPEGCAFTMALNAKLVEGATLPGLLEHCQTLQTTTHPNNNDMKNVGTIKRHLQFLAARGWCLERSEAGVIKLVDYVGNAVPFPYVVETLPAAEEQKAA